MKLGKAVARNTVPYPVFKMHL